MGKLLKKVRKNLLNNSSSFKIGFNNRSPFSYQLPSADPNSGVAQIDAPDFNAMGDLDRIEAEGDAARSIVKTISDTTVDVSEALAREDENKKTEEAGMEEFMNQKPKPTEEEIQKKRVSLEQSTKDDNQRGKKSTGGTNLSTAQLDKILGLIK